MKNDNKIDACEGCYLCQRSQVPQRRALTAVAEMGSFLCDLCACVALAAFPLVLLHLMVPVHDELALKAVLVCIVATVGVVVVNW
jgi:hypothetical protein